MIRVTIELLPFGQPEGRKHLGTIDIANQGDGTRTTGNYMVRLRKAGAAVSTWRKGVVTGFPRLKLGAYDLLLMALVATIGGRHKALLDDLHQQLLEDAKTSTSIDRGLVSMDKLEVLT